MERLTSRSSIGLAGWGNPMISQSGFTLFLRVHSARNLVAMGRGSYCKLYLGNSEVVNGSGASFPGATNQQPIQDLTHRVYRTKVLYTDQKSCPEWNDKLELDVLNPDTEILTVRVKNQLMLFCPVIGACAIPLCNVQVETLAEQWFPLYKRGKLAGHIRLQLLLKQKNPSPLVDVNESTMQKLVQQHCQQESERRHVQRDDDARRRHQFREQEIMQVEMKRQRQEGKEKEFTRIGNRARMQASQTPKISEEVQGYLQKQMQHEENWRTEAINHDQQVGRINMNDGPHDVRKKPNYLFADDMVMAATPMHPSDVSVEPNQSFMGSQEDNQYHEQVVEAMEVVEVVFGEVVDDALNSLDSSLSSSEGNQNRQGRHKGKERRRQHSRKHSRSAKHDKTRPSQVPLFPSFLEKSTTGKKMPSLSPAGMSSSSEDTSSSEEERRRRRHRRKEKKAKRKERRRKRKAKRKSRRVSDGYKSSSSSSSYSSSSSSSISSTDEDYKCKTRKHKTTKGRARSQQDGKTSTISRAPVPSHANSFGPDHSSYAENTTNKHNSPLSTYAYPTQFHHLTPSPPGYIKSLPPKPQQKRSVGAMISKAADVASILSDVASLATSAQQLAGGGDDGSGAGALEFPFALSDMGQIFEGLDLSTPAE